MKLDDVSIDHLSNGRIIAELRSPKGRFVALDLRPSGEQEITGDAVLTENPAIVGNLLLAIATHEASQNDALAEHKRKEHTRSTQKLIKAARELAALSDNLSERSSQAWCSHCLTISDHRRVTSRLPFVTYLCSTCGKATTDCTAPRCPHKAQQIIRATKLVPFCAEHRHAIPSFERANDPLPDLSDFRMAMSYDKINWARGTNYALVGVAAVPMTAFLSAAAAPAIGGMIGTKIFGYTGAAAVSKGLALLGGGSLATGGLGMAGGTALITTVGGVIGGAVGTSYLSRYLSEDKSFSIEKLRDGTGPAVVIARGFTTEKNPNWVSEVKFAELIHDNPTIYLLTWGAKELADIPIFAGVEGARRLGTAGAKKVASRASKVAAKNLNAIGTATSLLDLTTNPWHTAVSRAENAGRALAVLLSKTGRDDWVLIGHSLGARVMVNAALSLSNSAQSPRIENMHLLGAAISSSQSWESLAAAVSGNIHNYYSHNDKVLAWLYRVAQGNRQAVGRVGFATSIPKIIDHNVSDLVGGHSEYFRALTAAVSEEMRD